MKRRRILFLNHSASRNGASILLLDLLQWMKEHSDFAIHVLSLGKGPLLQDFRSFAPTLTLPRPIAGLIASSADTPSLFQNLLASAVQLPNYDLVYANTVATWRLVRATKRCNCPVLWHIHELSYGLRSILGAATADDRLRDGNRFVAVSQSVIDTLTHQFGVSSDKVDLVYGFVNVPALRYEDRRRKRHEILSTLGWPMDSFVVGACGSPGWRKGIDLFLQIAHIAHQPAEGSRMRFLWVGGDDEYSEEALRFQFDAAALQIEPICRRLRSTEQVVDCFAAMDVFALTSREDPFPLVVLEAGLQEVPTVCFRSGGGAPEFVRDEAGIVVDYPDVHAFAGALRTLQDDVGLRDRLGERARAKVQTAHSVESQGPKLVQCIEKCLDIDRDR